MDYCKHGGRWRDMTSVNKEPFFQCKKKKKNANRLSLFCSQKKTSDNRICTHSSFGHASSSGSDASVQPFLYSSIFGRAETRTTHVTYVLSRTAKFGPPRRNVSSVTLVCACFHVKQYGKYIKTIYAFDSADVKYGLWIKAGLQPFFPAEQGGINLLSRSKLNQPFPIDSEAVLQIIINNNLLHLI